MTLRVELIYDPDCPNVAPARAVLRAALARLGHAPTWTEWNRRDEAAPAYVQGFGSPTILVEGKDVAGVPGGEMPSCCRLYADGSGAFSGIPSAEQVVAALRREPAGVLARKARNHRGEGRATPLSGVGASFILAGLCPVCWTAFTGLFGALGIGFVLDTTFLLPATVLLLGLALFGMGFRATNRWGHGPLAIGVFAGVLTLVARFVLVSDLLTFLGLATLVGASVWNARPTGKGTPASCPKCITAKADER